MMMMMMMIIIVLYQTVIISTLRKQKYTSYYKVGKTVGKSVEICLSRVPQKFWRPTKIAV